MMDRRIHYAANLTVPDGLRTAVAPGLANIVSSELDSGMHAPALDLDFPCRLVSSSTPGHYHLYMDVEMTFEAYMAMLIALRDAGVLQRGFVDMAKRRGATFLRKQGVAKLPDDCNSVGGEWQT